MTLPPLVLPPRQLIVPTRCLRCGRWRTRRRYAPRDRLRAGLLNASSGLQISDTGIVVTDTGLLVTDGTETSSATCCCTGTKACTDCTGDLTVTFSSVAMAFHGCNAASTGCAAGQSSIDGATTFSGTFTVPKVGSCLWKLSQAYTTITASDYPGGSLCGTPTETTGYVLIVVSNGTGGVFVQFTTASGTSQSGPSVFNGTIPGGANFTGFTVANLNISADNNRCWSSPMGPSVQIASGGSVAISC